MLFSTRPWHIDTFQNIVFQSDIIAADVDEKKEGKTLKTTNAMIWAIERQLW